MRSMRSISAHTGAFITRCIESSRATVAQRNHFRYLRTDHMQSAKMPTATTIKGVLDMLLTAGERMSAAQAPAPISEGRAPK